jgi:hypothetical protein
MEIYKRPPTINLESKQSVKDLRNTIKRAAKVAPLTKRMQKLLFFLEGVLNGSLKCCEEQHKIPKL